MQRKINFAIIIKLKAVLRRIAGIAVVLISLAVAVHFIRQQFIASSLRIANAAFGDPSDLIGLTLICAAAGVIVIGNRSRRAKVRQSSD